MSDLLEVTEHGLWAADGGYHVDPVKPVPLAVVTHAHMDHARPGSERYLAPHASLPFLRQRLGDDAVIDTLPFGEPYRLGNHQLSFHPAGHVRGSAQVRIEADGDVWVVSGDYKRAADPTARGFEVVEADVFITEATFALPIYRWPSTSEVIDELVDWWRRAADDGRAAVLFCYAFGKAQRILAELVGRAPGPVWLHGAMAALTRAYREDGVELVETNLVAEAEKGQSWAGGLILAPPSARGTTWMRRFGNATTAFASGWMRVRGRRRWRGVDRGFVLSDHADWSEILATIRETGARRVLTTHGFAEPLARYLRDDGYQAEPIELRREGGDDDGSNDDASNDDASSASES
ncbi:MAG: ligase-associated DNA damage response exonuclease [Acidobacteriota bacterium]